uniref:Uncharacterized protein n=1 Tax=Parascaris univalens TaxID=6257 RepID=A0A915AK68_PARUN
IGMCSMPSEDAEHSEWETLAADDSSMSSHGRAARDAVPFTRFSSEDTYIQENINRAAHQDGDGQQPRTKTAEESSLLGRIDQLQETVIELRDKVAALSKAIYSQQETISKLSSSQDRSVAVFFTNTMGGVNRKTMCDEKVYSRSTAVQTAPVAEINTDVVPEVVRTSEWEACWYGTISGTLPQKKQNWQCIRGRRSNCRSGRILENRLPASMTSTPNNDLWPNSEVRAT